MRDLLVTTVVGTDGPIDDSFDDVLREIMGVDSPPLAPVLMPGLILDDAYRIEQEVGRGGMGRVYRAHDIRLERDVAIKIHVVLAIDGKRWSLREASALARLSHPNVVTVYEVGTHDNSPWVAMEYVPNGTARTWAIAEERSIDEILAVYIAAGRGLAAAHAADIVHRDFKPDNILLGADGQPRVADFGLALQLAKMDGNVARLTLGTPAYMAPEQWDRAPVGKAADQFAFATSLWETLTKQRPYRGKTEGEIRAAWKSPPPPPARPVPRHVETALRRALSIEPADRWPEMSQLLDELERDPRRTRRRVAIVVAAGLALASGGAVVATTLRGEPAASEPPCLHATDSFATVAKLRGDLSLSDPRTLTKLDAWIDTWRTNRTRACEDTYTRRTQPVEVLELRTLCFDRARAAAEATLPELPTSKDPISLVEALPRLAECDDVARMRSITPMPVDPVARGEIEAVSNELGRIRVMRNAGKTEEALELVEKLLVRARKTERKALIAETALLTGNMRVGNNKLDTVRALFEEASKLAAEAGDDFLVAKIWSNMIDLLSARLEQPAEAEKLIPVVETAVLRAGNNEMLRVDLQSTLAQHDLKQGRLESARTRLADALTSHPKVYGEDSELARLFNLDAGIAMRLSDYAGARTDLQRAAEILEKSYGPKYRHLAVVWTTLGQVEYSAGHYAESRIPLERAVALKEEVGGKDAATLPSTLTPLARTLLEVNEPELATSTIQRSIQLSRTALGPEHAKTLEALRVEVTILIRQTKDKLAEQRLLELLPLQRKLGAIAPLDSMELSLAEIYRRNNRIADARAAVERARPISAGGDRYMQAKVIEMSGRVEGTAGNRAKAVELFETAIAMLKELRGADHDETQLAQKALDEVKAGRAPGKGW